MGKSDSSDQMDNIGDTDLALEAFEQMDTRSFIYSVILFAACCIISLLFIWISPSPNLNLEHKIETQSNTKEVSIQLSMKNLKFYHRSLTFLVKSNNKFRAMGIIVTGFVKLKKNNLVIREFTIENLPLKLFNNKYSQVFSTGKFSVDEIGGYINFISKDQPIQALEYTWQLENSSFIFFHLLLKSVICIIITLMLFKFIRKVDKLESEPTYIQALTHRLSYVFAFCFLPIPEICYFMNIRGFQTLISSFEFVSVITLISYMVISAWDLSVHNADSEPQFIEKLFALAIFLIVVLLLPQTFKIGYGEIQNFLENWLGIFTILVIVFSLTIIPDRIKKQAPEHKVSIVHIAYTLIPTLVYAYFKSTNQKRISICGLLLFIYTAIAFSFILLLHWPEEASEYVTTYITIPKDSFPSKQDSVKRRKA